VQAAGELSLTPASTSASKHPIKRRRITSEAPAACARLEPDPSICGPTGDARVPEVHPAPGLMSDVQLQVLPSSTNPLRGCICICPQDISKRNLQHAPTPSELPLLTHSPRHSPRIRLRLPPLWRSLRGPAVPSASTQDHARHLYPHAPTPLRRFWHARPLMPGGRS
jgi:hypothetical protein